MLQEHLKTRSIPPLKSKEEMLELLLREEYGYLPPNPEKIRWKVTENYIERFCAGKATIQKVDITSTVCGKEFTFPVYVTIPAGAGKHPFFVCINFRDDIPDRYVPTEEIIDNGFAVLTFCYNDITKDNKDFSDGLAGILYKDGKRGESDAGKISMWAWAAHRVMDYASTLERLDKNFAVVCGHSRLGKTALLAAATDERFTFAFANESGCSGASLSRGIEKETIAQICERFPHWFSLNYQKYSNNEAVMPFDQHYLMACIAPRCIYIGNTDGDEWCDLKSEILTCIAASEAYARYDMEGIVCEDRIPLAGDVFHSGNIGYHLREGLHYFSREDWVKAINFIRKFI